MRKLRLIVVMSALALPFCIQLHAQTARRDAAFSDKLNDLGMIDYSYMFLKQKMAENPPDIDYLKVQLAATYMADNKVEEATRMLKQFDSSSKVYPFAQYKIGMALLRRQQLQEGANALMKYLNYYKPIYEQNPPKKDAERQEFRNAIGYANWAFKELKKVKEAQDVLDLLKLLENKEETEAKGGGALGGQDPEVFFFKVKTSIDAAENMKENGEKDWQKLLNTAMKDVDKLGWIFPNPIVAYATVEKVRCLYLLGRYDDALKAHEKYAQFIGQLDDAYRKEKQQGAAPGGGLRYWQGMIYLAKAKAAGSDNDKKKLYIQALKKFLGVLKKFEGHEKASDAFSNLLDCKSILEKDFGLTIKLPNFPKPDIKQKSVVDAATNRLYTDGKFAQAIPGLEAAIQAGRNKKGVEDAIYKLARSYSETNQPLLASATILYLGNRFANREQAPIGLLQVGQLIWNQAEALKDDTKKENLRDYSLMVYEMYLDKCKDHKYGGEIATRVANAYFKRASELAKEANKMPHGEERKAKAEQAVEAYKKSIPNFQFIIDNYGNREEYANLAQYMLGLAYNSSKDYLKSAAAYLRYCEIEKKDVVKLANAKLGAGDDFFSEGSKYEDEAKALRDAAYELPSGIKEEAPAAAEAPKEEAKAAEGEKKAEQSADAKKEEAKPAAKAADAKKEEAKPAPETAKKDEKKPEAKSDEPAALGENTREGKLAMAEAAQKKANDYFLMAANQLDELVNKWLVGGGRLGEPNNDKVRKTAESALQLLAWSYDYAGKKKAANQIFARFIVKYPKNKQVPACMMRMGVNYTELGDATNAEKILGALVSRYPDSPEGKNATYFLGCSLYDNGKYAKCLEKFKEIFAKKLETSVPSLRWMKNNLSKCPGDFKKEGSALALTACEHLLEMLKKPVLKDWFGPVPAQALEKDPKKKAKQIKIVHDRLIFDAGVNAYYAQDYKKCFQYLDKLLEDENTPYLFDAKFTRSDAYVNDKKYDLARGDLGDISMRVLGLKPPRPDLYAKVQVRIGDSFMAEQVWDRAFSAFNLIAAAALSEVDMSQEEDVNFGPTLTPEEKKQQEEYKKAENEWLEEAIYKGAYCAAKSGNGSDKDKLKAAYLKKFPKGRFINEIKKLPATASKPAPAEPK